jgi:uncharacterized protein involved in exopolysaccharide biosynthesis
MLIIVTFLVVLIATLVYCIATPPLYSTSSEVIVDPRDRQVLVNAMSPSGVAPDGGITQVESQVQVIQSNSVLLSAIAATHLTDDPEFNGTHSFSWLTEAPWLGSLMQDPSAVQSEESIREKTLRALRKRLVVKRAEKVFVIDIVITASSAQKAARIANAIADAYLAEEADAKAQAAEHTSAALTARLAEQRERVESAATAVDRYRATHNIVTANGQLVGEQKLSAISMELTAAQGLTATLRAKLDIVDRLRASGITTAATTEALGSPVVSKLREQEAALEQRRADLEARYGPQFPTITAIRQQIAEVNRLIGAELNRISAALQTDYNRSLNNERLLSEQFQQAKSATRGVDQASVKLRELERELDANRTVYSAFLGRAREISEQASIDTTNARVITRALPPLEKSWPPLKLLLVSAVVGGIGLGCCLALVREYANPTVLSRAQAETTVGAEVVGIMSGSMLGGKQRRRLGAARGNRRALATVGLTLRHLFYGDPATDKALTVHSLIVTSGPHDSECRREVCQLFASAAQLLGERVLLVDAERASREPVTYDILQKILHGRCSMDAIVNLAPSNGVVVLGKGRDQGDGVVPLRTLLPSQRHFDFLIIDGGIAAEDLSVAPLIPSVDQVLLVVRLGKTSQEEVGRVADRTILMGRRISAIVLVE